MRLGIDLDNTIIFYDDAFVREAIRRGLLPEGFKGSKQQVRTLIRSQDATEASWQALQGHVYGKGIGEAALFPGVLECLKILRARGAELFIVSHKTEFGHFDADRVNLREAAKTWLAERGVLELVDSDHVFFAATREEKIERIKALSLDCFIDDLVEVFEEKTFPESLQCILFHPSPAVPPKGRWAVCREWDEIHSMLAASELMGTMPDYIARAGNGGNSRIYKIGAGTKSYALKRYPVIAGDARDRMGAERMALQFFAEHAISSTPRWSAGHTPFALMEWIDGTAVTTPTAADIDAATAFLSQLFALSARAPADMPLASEACFSAAALMAQIHARLKKLSDVATKEPLLARFLTTFKPVLEKREAAARQALGDAFDTDLPQAERRLVAADFGFHNCLRRPDGTLAFIDFEYFGWDDPVKLFSDVLLHPAITLPDALKKRFYQSLIKTLPPAAEARFAALYPLFGLRWTLILLNEFLPERWQARAIARGDSDADAAKQRQVEKATAMLALSAEWI